MNIDTKMTSIQEKLNHAGIKIIWLKEEDSLRQTGFATPDFSQWHQALEQGYQKGVLTQEEAISTLEDLKEALA